MLKLLIARHGNTFDKGDVIRRVGLKTDLPLSNSGQAQCQNLGKYLYEQPYQINHIYCSELQRTYQTAELICQQLNYHPPLIEASSILNEIDYGVDEGKPEQEVIQRLGAQALKDWDLYAKVPPGWLFDSQKTLAQLTLWVNELIKKHLNQTILLITSNGIARFLPQLLENYQNFQTQYSLKMPTATISEFNLSNNHTWHCKYWAKKV